MIARKPISAPPWADPESFSSLLDRARQFAGEYIDSLGQRPVFPTEASLQAMNSLNEPLPETSCDPAFVLKQLHEIGSPGAVNQTAGRYFGFVNGGMLPVGSCGEMVRRCVGPKYSPLCDVAHRFAPRRDLRTLDRLAASSS